MSEEAKLANQLSWAIRASLVATDPLQRQSSADKKASQSNLLMLNRAQPAL